jgi:glycosyltransferase involved in cell wall biosynthesis
VAAPSIENGVHWLPLENASALPPLDAAVALNSTRLFHGVRAARKLTWWHNPPAIRQQVKRRNLLALLRHRPVAVLLSAYQSGLLPWWIPYRGRAIIHHGVGENFFLASEDDKPRKRRAVFASQPSRGLAFVAECWRKVNAALPDAELHVFCPQAKQEEAARLTAGASGIVVRGSVSRDQLGRELREARVMLIPGVADETFCLAAAEATASGVPLVTLGIGALAERVRDGETGFLVADGKAFSEAAIRLMRDDNLWLQQHRACVSHTGLARWSDRAREWENLLYSSVPAERAKV